MKRQENYLVRKKISNLSQSVERPGCPWMSVAGGPGPAGRNPGFSGAPAGGGAAQTPACPYWSCLQQNIFIFRIRDPLQLGLSICHKVCLYKVYLHVKNSGYFC